MHPTVRPLPHRKVEEIAKLDRFCLAKHVVMFVHMENELRGGKRSFCESLLPILKGFVMMVHDLIYWPVRPIKQFVEPVEGIIEEVKVVQVYVKDGGHRIVTMPANCV